LVRGSGTGAVRAGTGGRVRGLSVFVVVEAVGRDVVLPDMSLERAAAVAATFGRAGTGGGILCLAGTGGGSLVGSPAGALGVFGAAES